MKAVTLRLFTKEIRYESDPSDFAARRVGVTQTALRPISPLGMDDVFDYYVRSVDHEIHARLIDGDETALGEVYDNFSGLIYGLALRVSRDKSAAEDITQETIVTLWQYPEKFDPHRGSLRAWLCTIAHRRAVDFVRKSETQRRYARLEACETSNDQPIDEFIINVSENKELSNALSSLPIEQREALILAYLEGRTYRQVAEQLQIPEGTAKSRIRLGLARLAKTLSNQEVMMQWSEK